MHVLQSHAINPRSEREEDEDRKGVAREHNSHQRISNDLKKSQPSPTRKSKMSQRLGMNKCLETQSLIHRAPSQITYILIAIHRIGEGYIAGYYKAKAKNTVPDGKHWPGNTLQP